SQRPNSIYDPQGGDRNLNQEQAKDVVEPADLERLAAAAAAVHFRITYLFPHPEQNFEEASRFGWYTPGVLATALPMLQACTLPADIREAHSDLEDVLVHRLTGAIWPHLLPVQISSFEPVLGMVPSPFIVCITTSAEV